MINKRQNEKGQSFFEMIVAITVISVGLIALAGLVSRVIANTTFSKYQTLATRYTQEATEWIRGQRDDSWANFYARSSSAGRVWCLRDINSWGTSGSCGSSSTIAGTPFRREATLQRISQDIIRVTVITSWNDSNGIHDSRTIIELTNWKRQ